ncbi:MAG: hypothetical protein ABWZ57_17985 [Mesorhizobium sp.]|jgi:hypothetical protein
MSITGCFRNLLGMSAALAVLVAGVPGTASAQGLESKESVEKIVGTPVEEETRPAADAGRILAAIDKTSENISAVRKVSDLDKVDIVFLPDAAATEGGPPPEIDAKVKEHQADVTALREEIEGNAMLFHAIDSRQILPRDILAVEFEGKSSVVIYAAAKPAR